MKDSQKKLAGEKAIEYITDGMIVGLGTGSTTQFFIKKIGEEIKKGLDIKCIPTSLSTEKLAQDLEIPLSCLSKHQIIDITIDGADQVDPDLNLIKGGGGALLREKIVASCSKKVIIVVDESKMVKKLSYPLPVEVLPFGWKSTRKKLERLGLVASLRINKKTFVTDNNNFIIDCRYQQVTEELETKINMIPGVIEHGFFRNMVNEVVIGTKKGIKKIKNPQEFVTQI
jgi:ribose 5-phosphate isomerase A